MKVANNSKPKERNLRKDTALKNTRPVTFRTQEQVVLSGAWDPLCTACSYPGPEKPEFPALWPFPHHTKSLGPLLERRSLWVMAFPHIFKVSATGLLCVFMLVWSGCSSQWGGILTGSNIPGLSLLLRKTWGTIAQPLKYNRQNGRIRQITGYQP